MKISILLPVLNESTGISETLRKLQPLREQGHEVIVVDGGSTDDTCQLSAPFADKVLISSPGRAKQMNLGASQSSSAILLFLHADTLLYSSAADDIQQQLEKSSKCWGRFNVRLSGNKWPFRIIEMAMNVRSCISGIATGDQGIFLYKQTFDELGGFPEIPLMEDIALSKKLKKFSRPVCLRGKLITSSRRWEKGGILNTILLMWQLRFLYAIGISSDVLARKYQ